MKPNKTTLKKNAYICSNTNAHIMKYTHIHTNTHTPTHTHTHTHTYIYSNGSFHIA